ncbi:MAG: peptide deformylase [Nitrospinae bacterium]|nr:peptide deformylase [Nitrospinota bacterium]
MSILKVAQMGHPVLRRVAEGVSPETLADPAIQRLIDDMIDTMRELDGAGLAAPQVHASKRIVVVEGGDNPRYPEAPEFPLTVLVNPTLRMVSEETAEDFEGCLSVDGLVGLVRRPVAVVIDAFDRYGKPLTIEAEGFTARAFQHELDHLDGVLYVDRLVDTKKLFFRDEFRRYGRGEEE